MSEAALRSHVPRAAWSWEGRRAYRDVDATLLSLDITGYTSLTERLAEHGRQGVEELVGLVNACFAGPIDSARRWSGDILEFGGDALLVLFEGADHATRAAIAATEMLAEVTGERGTALTDPIMITATVGIHSGPMSLLRLEGAVAHLLVAGPVAGQTITHEKQAEAGTIVVSAATATALPIDVLEEMEGGSAQLLHSPPAPLASAVPVEAAAADDVTDPAAWLSADLLARAANGSALEEIRPATTAFIRFRDTEELFGSRGTRGAARLLTGLAQVVDQACADFGVTWFSTTLTEDGGQLHLAAGALSSSGRDDADMLRAVRAIVDTCPDPILSAGIARGRLFVGTVGTPWRQTSVAMGDSVNAAARLAARAEPGQVLAMADVVLRSDEPYATTRLEPMHVKGKAEPLDVVAVGDLVVGAPTQDPAADTRLPMFGRDEELALLHDALQATRASNEEHGVRIRGPKGSGKTRLIQEFLDTIDVTGSAVACDQYATGTPYHLARLLLRNMLGIDADANAKEAGNRLLDIVRTRAPDLTAWTPLMAIPLEASVPLTEESDRIAPQFRRLRMQRAVTDLLHALIDGPTVAVIEEADWLDDSSRELLADVVDGLYDRPLLVCVAGGDDLVLLDELDAEALLDLPLGPLPTQAALALVDHVVADRGLLDSDISHILEDAGGRALFLVELARVARTGQGKGLPDTVEAAVTARLDALPSSQRDMLRQLAAFGSKVVMTDAIAVLSDQWPDLTGPTGWAALHPFIEVDETTLRFAHGVYQEVAYESLPFARRRELHERIAAHLAATARDRPGFLELMAHHSIRAERADEAWQWARQAADHARDRWANDEAVDFYLAAITAAESLGITGPALADVCESLGDTADLAGRFDDAERGYELARLHHDSGPLRDARLLERIGRLRERTGALAQTLEWYADALEILWRQQRRDGGDPELLGQLAELEVATAGIKLRQGSYDETIAWALWAIGHAEQAGDRARLARAWYIHDVGQAQRGTPAGARFGEQAISAFDEIGDLLSLAAALNNRGIGHYFLGHWNQALGDYERSRVARDQAGDVVGAATAENNIAEVLSDQGHHDRAIEMLRHARRAFTRVRYQIGMTLTLSNLSRAMLRRGDVEEGVRGLEQARAEFVDLGAETFTVETDARLLEGAVLAGDHAAVLRDGPGLLDRTVATGGGEWLLAAVHRAIGCASSFMDPSAVEASLTESLARAEDSGSRFEIALSADALNRWRNDEDPQAADRVQRLVAELGIVAVPRLPLQPRR